MNERIRELYYQCQDEGLSTEECYQNFAELIVRECADHIMTSTDRHRREYFATMIKRHFGVEE